MPLIAVHSSDLALLIVGLLVAGLTAGFLAGLLGIGGGGIMVPVLYEVFGLFDIDADVRMHLALGTTMAVNVRLRRKVHNRLRRGGRKEIRNSRTVPNVDRDECISRVGRSEREPIETRRVCEAIRIDDLTRGISHETADERRPNESCAAGDQDLQESP
jgi:hypothetical protein